MIKFTDSEKKILSTLSDTDKTIKQVSSVYAFYLKRESMSFILNLKRHYKDYLNKKGTTISTKISFSWFEKITRRLIKSGLIITKKQGRTNTYSCPRIIENETTMSENVSEIVSESKLPQSVENTNINGIGNSSNHKPYKDYININYDTVSCDTAFPHKNNKAYRKAIEKNNKDTLSSKELCTMALNRLKHFGKRSKFIQLDLLRRLQGKVNIVRVNSLKYIDVVIADCIAYHNFNREKYAKKIVENTNKYRLLENLKNNLGVKANFTQRVYDCVKMERQLVWGEDLDEESEDIKTNTGNHNELSDISKRAVAGLKKLQESMDS